MEKEEEQYAKSTYFLCDGVQVNIHDDLESDELWAGVWTAVMYSSFTHSL